MAQPESTIVPFKSGNQSFYKGKKDAMKGHITSECRSLYSRHFGTLHHEFFNKIDDELFSLSDKAENSTLQSIYFEAMRFIRKERAEIEKRILSTTLKYYDDFWGSRTPCSPVLKSAEVDEDSFSLVENEVLEEDLAISTMIDKLNKLLHSELYGLNRRFAALLGQEDLDGELNPIGPNQICHGFEEVIKPLVLDLKVKLVIYKLYDNFLSLRLNTVYKEINTLLINADILPKLARKIRRPGSSPMAVSDNAIDKGVSQSQAEFQESASVLEVVDSASDLQAFQEFQSLLGGWRIRNGFSSRPGAPVAGESTVPAYATSDVINLLSEIQVDHHGRIDSGARGLKFYVTDHLRSSAPDQQNRPLAESEEDIIDMVGMIFDFILDDDNLPDSVKAVIGRLQIPVVKVAILDKGFFSRKTHPARELLNKLAKAGSNLDEMSGANSHLLAEIESIVETVLSRFDRDTELFSILLERFQAFLEKDEQRSRVVEDRTRQVTESKEQLELAKTKVGFVIIRCIQGKEIPVVVRSFLNDAWKHVLLLAYLRKDKAFNEWQAALAVVTRLLWTVTPPEDLQEKKNILLEIPRLIRDIRIGLENISYDPHKMSAFLKDLEACHMHALNTMESNDASQSDQARSASTESVQGVEKTSGELQSHVKLAEEIDSLCAGMSQLDQSLFNDLDRGIARAGSAVEEVENVNEKSLESDQDNDQTEDEFTVQASGIEAGQWLSFTDENNEVVKAKLSWKSQVTSTYIFVNAKGSKVAEKSLQEVAGELREGKAEIIRIQPVPLMDRAMSALAKTLTNVEEVSAACV